jgi:hypothetical protein
MDTNNAAVGRIRPRSSPIFLVFLLNGLFLISCAKYTVTTSQNDKADVQLKTKVLTSYFWGAVNKPKIGVIDSTCGNAGLERVVISTNTGYTLLQVITLGIVNKMKVQWYCQKEQPRVEFHP